MASKPKINKMITKVNFSDSNRSAGQIKYLVKHFVGATGGAEAGLGFGIIFAMIGAIGAYAILNTMGGI